MNLMTIDHVQSKGKFRVYKLTLSFLAIIFPIG